MYFLGRSRWVIYWHGAVPLTSAIEAWLSAVVRPPFLIPVSPTFPTTAKLGTFPYPSRNPSSLPSSPPLPFLPKIPTPLRATFPLDTSPLSVTPTRDFTGYLVLGFPSCPADFGAPATHLAFQECLWIRPVGVSPAHFLRSSNRLSDTPFK